MPKFEFRLPSQPDIMNSANGQIMLSIMDNDYDEHYTLVSGVAGAGLEIIAFFRVIRSLNEGKRCCFYLILK